MSATASCADDIRAAIAAAGGAIRFDQYLELALYGPHGFYTAGVGRAGRRGDFLTSPEVGPLFGVVVSRWIDAAWDELGQPDPFTVVDAGAGPGTLARSVLAAGPRCRKALRYVAVERSAPQRAVHPPGVTSLADVPAEPFAGVVIANELLDNLPFRLLVNDGGWRDAWVAADGERFVEITRPLTDGRPAWLPARAPHGARVPMLSAACDWLRNVRALLTRGRMLLIDYGRPTTAEMALLPWREWLRTYAGHDRGSHYLRSPGAQDVTTDVPVDQVVDALDGADTAVRTQRQFLQRWGIDDLVAEGREAWQRAAARPDLAALAMRSRAQEAAALTDPDGLGGFLAIEVSQ